MKLSTLQFPRWCLFIATLLVVPFSATAETRSDPLEGYNRAMFAVNETADKYILKPIATGYHVVTPDPVEHSIRRVFSNLGEIRNVVNDLLQGKPGQAANDTGRFLINTTIGIVGLFDVAQEIGLEKPDGEDFGQTLGKWGIGSGPYIVLPLLGPSTLRDGPARLVDSFLNPVMEIDHIPTRNSVIGTDVVSTRAELLDAEELISGDKYVFLREVYLQRRAYLISDGMLEDDFGSELNDVDDDYGY